MIVGKKRLIPEFRTKREKQETNFVRIHLMLTKTIDRLERGERCIGNRRSPKNVARTESTLEGQKAYEQRNTETMNSALISLDHFLCPGRGLDTALYSYNRKRIRCGYTDAEDVENSPEFLSSGL